MSALLLALAAQAQDTDQALASFTRPAATAPRPLPLDSLAWEPALRPLGQPAPAPSWRAIDDALVDAARAGKDEVLRKLLHRGAALDRMSQSGFTPLGAAAWAGWRTTVRLLLRAGADAAALGASGQTALHLAALAGHRDVVADMLRLGVAIDQLNKQRETALDVAAIANQQPVMELLLSAGADAAGAGRR